MTNFFKKFWKILALPIIFLLVFFSLWAFWHLLKLPTNDEFIALVQTYFDIYGLWFIFLSAIVEGLLLIGCYYPGSVVIFLGVIFAGKEIIKVVEVVSLISFGFFIAQVFNFFVGKYGWYKILLKCGLRKPLERAQQHLAKYGTKAIIFSYWQPNLAAFTSTAAGILQLPTKKFLMYSLGSIMVWNIFWGSLVYFFGKSALSLIGLKFVLIVAIVMILYKLWPYILRKIKLSNGV